MLLNEYIELSMEPFFFTIENGYSDWFLPNFDQLGYAISGGCEYPDERTDNYLWTRTKEPGSTAQYALIISESATAQYVFSYSYSEHNCRCVRFGLQQVSGDAVNLSQSSSLVGGFGIEQPITMIGPMYINTEFSEF